MPPVSTSLPAVPVNTMSWLVTVRSKLSATLRLSVSVAVTLRFTSPTSLLPGVPLNMRVVPLKVSQAGRAFPLANVAW